MANERWDGDETGAGISDGEAFAPPLRALLDEMARADWNTEAPEAHLLPHLERWLAVDGAPLSLLEVRNEDGILVLDLDARGADRWDLRQLVYPLIATVAEPTTAIVERDDDRAHVYDVTAAVAPWQSAPFPKGHGHLLRIRVLGATSADEARAISATSSVSERPSR